MLYMLGLGYGLGALLPQVDGMPYITFLAAGTVCYSTMNSATFEALYSALLAHARAADLGCDHERADESRRHRAWPRRCGRPAKSFLSGMAILLIIWVLGLSHSPLIAVDHSAHRPDRADVRLRSA